MNYFPYQEPPSMYRLAYQFQHDPTQAAFLVGMSIAWISAIVSSRAGIAFGDWLLRLRR
jgi:hypothetical protein